MFDIGWSELVVIAVVALVAIGPKELPGVLRMVGQWLGKARRMASEFQGQFNEAMREAEMADLKKTFDDVKEAASGLGAGNLLTSLNKDVSDAMSIDKIDKMDSADNASDASSVVPTTPEPPTPETFIEAETHAAAMEPLAIVREFPPEIADGHVAADAGHDPVAAAPAPATDVAKTDNSRDAKAS